MKTKKLNLAKATISNLSNLQMEAVKGGSINTRPINCPTIVQRTCGCW